MTSGNFGLPRVCSVMLGDFGALTKSCSFGLPVFWKISAYLEN